MEDTKKVAEGLLEDLNKELLKSEENSKMIKGAMEGIKLMFQKLTEEVEEDGPESSEPVGKEKAKKAK